jgi:hypothetical protein
MSTQSPKKSLRDYRCRGAATALAPHFSEDKPTPHTWHFIRPSSGIFTSEVREQFISSNIKTVIPSIRFYLYIAGKK